MRSARGHPVLLHGFTGSAASWGGAVVDGLAGAGLSPVLVDLPGHGARAHDAAAAGHTLDAALDVVASSGDWPADLVGYSMGARVALHFAAAFPDRVRRLVLESGSPGLATEEERRERRASDHVIAERILRDGIEAFVDFWEARPLFESRRRLPPEVLAHQRTLRLGNDPQGLAAALTGLGSGALPGLWDRLPEIGTPTLLLVGDLDAKFVSTAERMADEMPNARVWIVPDAGHTVHLERPGLWLEAVLGFLRG